jgi:hypothetical protein
VLQQPCSAHTLRCGAAVGGVVVAAAAAPVSATRLELAASRSADATIAPAARASGGAGRSLARPHAVRAQPARSAVFSGRPPRWLLAACQEQTTCGLSLARPPPLALLLRVSGGARAATTTTTTSPSKASWRRF